MILIAEDEERIASFIEKGLNAAGHQTLTVTDGKTAAAVARDDAFDLVILDLGLPGIDGLSVLRQLRARGEVVPVVILTARDGLHATLAGFEGGADDYLTKPFHFEELLARVTARLRGHATADTSRLCVGDTTLDRLTRTIDVAGTTHQLSAREYSMAEVFFEHPGQVLSREQLLSRVWGYDFDPLSNVVDVYVGYLRRKLGNSRIQTVRGMGYRLAQQP